METRRFAIRPDAPKDAASLKASAHLEDIYQMLCSGWSPARCHAVVLQHYGEDLPEAELTAYREFIPPEQIISPGFIRGKLLQLDYQIDAVGEMARLLVMQQERLAAAVLLEDATNAQSPITEHSMLIYWKMLGDYILFRQKLGELPEPKLGRAKLGAGPPISRAQISVGALLDDLEPADELVE